MDDFWTCEKTCLRTKKKFRHSSVNCLVLLAFWHGNSEGSHLYLSRYKQSVCACVCVRAHLVRKWREKIHMFSWPGWSFPLRRPCDVIEILNPACCRSPLLPAAHTENIFFLNFLQHHNTGTEFLLYDICINDRVTGIFDLKEDRCTFHI